MASHTKIRSASRTAAAAAAASGYSHPGSDAAAASRRLRLLTARAEKSGGSSSTGGGKWEVTLSVRTPGGREKVLTCELEVRWNCCPQDLWAMRFLLPGSQARHLSRSNTP